MDLKETEWIGADLIHLD